MRRTCRTEESDMYKFSTVKLKAEMWDRMQHVMERYNDHMIHGYFRYDGQFDIGVLRKAVALFIDKVPVLRSVYKAHFFDAYWRVVENPDMEKIVQFEEVTDADAAAHAFLTRKIDECKETQLYIKIFRQDGKDTFAILFNHMCMDGGDFKEMMAVLSALYNDILAGGDGSSVNIKTGTRSERQLFREFSKEENEKYSKLLSYSKKQKDKIKFPYSDMKRKNLKPAIMLAKLGKEEMAAAKAAGKARGITVNTMLFTCFFRAVHRLIDIGKDQALGVPCMVDLRTRYISSGKSEGFCNLTSMVVPNIGSDIGETLLDTAALLSESFAELFKKDNFPGLHGLILLDKVFEIAPYKIAKFLIGTFFKNPLIGISNIGIIDEKGVTFGGMAPVDAWMTGSIKYPPYIQLSTTTYRGEMTFQIASYVNDEDKKTVDKFYGYLLDEFRQFAELK